ncbi:hypothetical protein LY474_00860 [Myxococcus stipitatus]|uniref:hypothetical protein n=1 Tax=Myxococcus stipitatus TaxID=83455 RepID=UPI001F3B108D|nr:hypothetical protein [Myxococcus stipitatus]MCE9666347.1 hypothetical protein [Myxococcus stipitatus]
MSERQIEMYWRCSSCNHRNLGRHMVCRQCKNAKDGSEQYEMPEDPSSAVTVTDEALLRMALAGPNWRCAYCDSDQRALDGSCKNCGAAVPEMSPSAPDDTSDTSGSSAPRESLLEKSRRRPGCTALLVLAVVFGCCCPCWMSSKDVKPGSPAPAAQAVGGPEWTRSLKVTEVSWVHTVSVDRYLLVENEGFAEDRPERALAVKAQGKRHHHDDEVLEGYETVYFTESVQKGYSTESYREDEPCGQDCETTPKKCKETCTSNRNGFATCKTTCTGGNRECSTRYCSVKKTRKVPRYVDERRSRQEPRYRSVPRSATWFTWKEWEWKFDRKVTASGATTETRWPTDAELRPVKPLAKGERERSERSGTYRVVLKDDANPPVTYTPTTLEEFQRFPLGSTHTVQKEGDRLTVIPPKPSESATAAVPETAPTSATVPATAQGKTSSPTTVPGPASAKTPSPVTAPARSKEKTPAPATASASGKASPPATVQPASAKEHAPVSTPAPQEKSPAPASDAVTGHPAPQEKSPAPAPAAPVK